MTAGPPPSPAFVNRYREHFGEQWQRGSGGVGRPQRLRQQRPLQQTTPQRGAASNAQAGLYSGTANLVDHNLTFAPRATPAGTTQPGAASPTTSKPIHCSSARRD